jgi:DNA-binding transcriptional LysR family regulator
LLDTLSGPAFDLVRDGKVDFALTAADPKQEDLAYEQLMEDQFFLICPDDHPLSKQAGPVAIENTLDYPHVSMPSSASVRQYIDADLHSKGLYFAPVFEVDHIATIGAWSVLVWASAHCPKQPYRCYRPAALRRFLCRPLEFNVLWAW